MAVVYDVHGINIPLPYRGPMELKTARLTLLIDPNKKAAFERLCAQRDLTASQVVRQLIRDYLAAARCRLRPQRAGRHGRSARGVRRGPGRDRGTAGEAGRAKVGQAGQGTPRQVTMPGLPPPSQWLAIDWMLRGRAGLAGGRRRRRAGPAPAGLRGPRAVPARRAARSGAVRPGARRAARHARGGGVAHRPAQPAVPPAAGQPGRPSS